MAGTVSRQLGQAPAVGRRGATAESAWVRVTLILALFVFLALFLFVPLASVFAETFKKGVDVYLEALVEPDVLSAIHLTLTTAAIAVSLNVVLSVAAAWAIARFEFRGKNLLPMLIDLPFSALPVTAGLIYVLLLGAQGWLGPYLSSHDSKVIFVVPGIVLIIVSVTFPFVARELIPLMQVQGGEEEEAAIVFGALGWQTFFRVTLSNIKQGLLYGMILCNARAMGELGAVPMVSGHIRGLTNTMPLHVGILYNEYNFAAAFAAVLLLMLLALVMLALKTLVEQCSCHELADADAGVGEGPGAHVAAFSSSSNPNLHISVQSPLEGSAV